MTFSSLVRNRSSGSTGSLGAAEYVGGPQASSTEDDPFPFAGYERLDADKVIERLSDHSQIELEAIENYERSHKGRETVLNKLRYLRGNEPFPGYDALSVEETLATLKNADMETIKRVRGYERKFANRPRVLDEVVRLHKERRAMQPATRPPGYQPSSARSGASARRARRGPEDGGEQRP